MKRILLSILISICLSALPQYVQAQFEGQIDFLIHNYQDGNQEVTNLDMTFAKDRIYLGSQSTLDVMSGLSTNGILVRNDHQDFVFMTGHNEALKVAKSDIDGLVNLINRVQGKAEPEEKTPFRWDEKVVETGNTKTINGYQTREFVLKSDENNGSVSVWLTDQIKVNWGLLNEVWHTTGSKQLGEEIPIELVMNRNSFPLLIEAFEDDIIVLRAESVVVNTRNFDRSKIELSSDLKMLGFADLMMNMFRQRR
ncbi:MAG: hypothetical protein EA390_07675 [Balneolaceae bacterium]|nr:MAG: hypothetical protein EA390_07675 [Balneolaceae bacterium]